MSEIYIRVCAGNEKSLKIDCSLKKEKEKLLKIKCIVLQFCKYVKIFLQLCFLCTRKHMKEPTYAWFHCFKVVEKWHCNYFFCLFIILQSRLLLLNERPYTNFCFEIKGHRQASKLCAFDCSMFSYLLMFFFPESPEPTQLVCASCNAEFSAAWDLCQHAQQEHSLSIYKTVNHCLSFVFKKH